LGKCHESFPDFDLIDHQTTFSHLRRMYQRMVISG
jgi:hypothetical protein